MATEQMEILGKIYQGNSNEKPYGAHLKKGAIKFLMDSLESLGHALGIITRTLQ